MEPFNTKSQVFNFLENLKQWTPTKIPSYIGKNKETILGFPCLIKKKN
jgi:hypothetical protein